LARPADQHLTRDELEALVPLGVDHSVELSPQGAEEAASHMEQCEVCRSMAATYAAVQSRLASLKTVVVCSRSAVCPPDDEWLSVAARLLPPEQISRDMEHAAICDHCGPLLRQAMDDFADELTSDEQVILNSLKSTTATWQRALASRLGPGAQDDLPKEGLWIILAKTLFRPRVAFAVAACALTVAIWFFAKLLNPPSADQLLTQAYSDHRTLETRMIGAKYTTLQIQRTGSPSSLDKSPYLLKAETLISENLRKRPDDPVWLQARGRAELLEWNYDSAIASLRSAMELRSNSPSIEIDLASAYVERGDVAHRPIDYGSAANLLSKILSDNPDDPIALFNRAVTYEKLFLYNQAVSDWTHYLRIDPDGPWADEAKQRLTALRQKLSSDGHAGSHLELAPQAFLNPSARGTNAQGGVNLEQPEDYLDIATRSWLPDAFPNAASSRISHSQKVTRRALELLATSLASTNSDHWLREMLDSRPSRSFSNAVSVLAKAIQLDAIGDFDQATKESRRADQLFRTAGSEAGIARALYESAYSEHRSAQGYKCLERAAVLNPLLKPHNYTWLQVQLLLEEASCNGMAGNLKSAQQYAEAAVNLASTFQYHTAYLRALGIAASLDTAKGDFVASWAKNDRGLSIYWSATYPPARAYQFYSELSFVSEKTDQMWGALAFARESLTTLTPDGDHSVAAWAHYRVANLAANAGQNAEAIKEYTESDRFFSSLPNTDSTAVYRMDGQVARASLEAQQGHFEDSATLLSAVRPNLAKVATFTVPMRFYTTLGNLELHRKRYSEAERALRAAAHIGELGATTIQTEHDRLAWNRELRTTFRQLAKIRFSHEGHPEDALDLWEWYRTMALEPPERGPIGNKVAQTLTGIDFAELDAGPPLPTLHLAQNSLPLLRHTTVVSYSFAADGIMVWAFDDRGILARWVGVSKKDFAQVAQRFKSECSNPGSDLRVLRQHGKQLYDWLIAPIQEKLETTRTLTIEPDELIDDLAMQALVDRSDNYLGFRFTIEFSPGLAFTDLGNPPMRFGPNFSALVVDASSVTGTAEEPLLPLADAAREAEAVAVKFQRAELLSGNNATTDAVLAKLPDFDIFHFAGHAIARPERSGLMLSIAKTEMNSELLDSTRLTSLPLKHCFLVVLSACSTAGSQTEPTVNLDNLVGTFLHAGAVHVVATRWNVDSRATASLMDAFYSALLKDSDVALALRTAQLSVSQTELHPYYWAAFSDFVRDRD
jgi:CHAT domain-containing protein